MKWIVAIYWLGFLMSLAYPKFPFSSQTLKEYLASKEYEGVKIDKPSTALLSTLFFWVLAAILWPIRMLINWFVRTGRYVCKVPQKPRKFGSAKDQIKMTSDFDKDDDEMVH